MTAPAIDNITLASTYQSVLRLLDEHEIAARETRDLLLNDDITPTRAARRMAEKRELGRWLWAMQRNRDDAEAVLAAAEERVTTARSSLLAPTLGVDGAALELAATRRWHGICGRLDALPLGQIASAAFAELRVAKGDRRRVLAEELPDYLAARREPFDRDDLDAALAASDPDGLGAAITERDSIAREHSALVGAIDLATDHIASDRIAAENEGALAIQVRGLVQLHH